MAALVDLDQALIAPERPNRLTATTTHHRPDEVSMTRAKPTTNTRQGKIQMNYRLALPLLVLAIGCSPTENDHTFPGVNGRSSSLTQSSSQFAATQPPPDDLDTTRPYFIRTRPGMNCHFTEPGTGAPQGTVEADADGRVYFFPPPKSWGSSLDVSCTAGATTQTFVGNLSDSSTYQVDTALAQNPASSGVRPALTDGDSISDAEILRRGYPPRPDSIRNTDQYKRWVGIVSSPRPTRNVKFIIALGRQAGHYVSTYSNINSTSQYWSGRVFDAAGFTATTDPDFPVKPNNNSSWYGEYRTVMRIPSTVCTGGSCFAYVWGGMGGMETRDLLKNTTFVQSGLFLQSGSSPVIFAEYSPYLWLGLDVGFSLDAGDDIDTWGWIATDTDCNGVDTTRVANVACFAFYNYTTGTYATYGDYWIRKTSGLTYYGWTYESIVENKQGQSLINYNYLFFLDLAWDASNSSHDAFSDPWILVKGGPGHITSQPNPADTNDADEYEMDWLMYQ